MDNKRKTNCIIQGNGMVEKITGYTTIENIDSENNLVSWPTHLMGFL